MRENLSSGLPIRSDTNRTVPPQKMVRGLKFWFVEIEGLCYLCSENKGADQLRRSAPLFSHICKTQVFAWHSSFIL